MKVVVDTNIIVSGFLWYGPSRRMMDLARERKIEMGTTRLLFTELDQTLHYRKFKIRLRKAGLAVRDIKFNASRILKFIRRSTAGPSVLDDPLDDEVLGCAIDFTLRRYIIPLDQSPNSAGSGRDGGPKCLG